LNTKELIMTRGTLLIDKWTFKKN